MIMIIIILMIIIIIIISIYSALFSVAIQRHYYNVNRDKTLNVYKKLKSARIKH